MADDVKISALGAASALDGTEIVPLVQGGTTKRTTVSGITSSGAPAAHASSHISGGGDAIAGQSLAVTQAVSNYTPGANTLSGHLTGIDTALGSVGGLPSDTGKGGQILSSDGIGNADWLVSFTSQTADGASAVAWTWNTAATYATSGAKLASFKNNGTEKAYIDKDGGALFGIMSFNGVTGLQSCSTATTNSSAPFYKVSTSEGGFAIGRYAYGAYITAYNKNGSGGGRTADLLIQGQTFTFNAGITNSTGNAANPNVTYKLDNIGQLTTNSAYDLKINPRTAGTVFEAPRNTIIYGHNAYSGGTTYITGGYVELRAGDGASGSVGAANGADVLLTAGTGYGTGHDGYIKCIGAAAHFSAPASAPASADQANGTLTFYLDESGNNVIFQCKYSDGTVKSATVALV